MRWNVVSANTSGISDCGNDTFGIMGGYSTGMATFDFSTAQLTQREKSGLPVSTGWADTTVYDYFPVSGCSQPFAANVCWELQLEPRGLE